VKALGVAWPALGVLTMPSGGLSNAERASQDKVAEAGGERGNERRRIQIGSGAGELGGGGVGDAASGLDDGSAVAAVRDGDRGRGVAGRRDGAGRVGGSTGGRAGHGDSVDAVDSRGDVDGGIIGLRLGSEDAGDERKEEDNDGLEGAHGV